MRGAWGERGKKKETKTNKNQNKTIKTTSKQTWLLTKQDNQPNRVQRSNKRGNIVTVQKMRNSSLIINIAPKKKKKCMQLTEVFKWRMPINTNQKLDKRLCHLLYLNENTTTGWPSRAYVCELLVSGLTWGLVDVALNFSFGKWVRCMTHTLSSKNIECPRDCM